MRTAIVSDLHLGSVSGEDVARDTGIRAAMLEEIAGADRVVLLGDVVELREQPLGGALEATRPFFEELGSAVAGEIVLVPGNHDHRLAESLLDDLSLSGAPLSLQQRFDPSPGPTAQIDRWLGGGRLGLAYPGLWLRDDVYATHGHYVDCHLSLPRAECIAAAAAMRSRPLPAHASPGDYERVLRPIYSFSFGRAQSRTAAKLTNAVDRPSEAVWKLAAGGSDSGAGLGRRLAAGAVRTAVPGAVWSVNRLLHAHFDPDFSPRAILRSGLEATAELAARLDLKEGVHLIAGHTHRGGPYDDDGSWPLPGGGQMHNTGSWLFASAFHHPGTPPSPYWPGTVTWIEDDAAPRRVQLLRDRSHAAMAEAVALSRSAATPR